MNAFFCLIERDSDSALDGSAFSFHCLEVWLVHFLSNFVATKCLNTLMFKNLKFSGLF